MFKPISFLILAICLFSPRAQAGVFNIPEFVEYKSWAIGVEPEVTLSSQPNTSSDGIGINLKFTYGILPISNLQVGVGTGSGSRGFRLGGTYTFDILPDLENQLGAGIAFQGYYYKLKGELGQTELTLYPYLHHTIKGTEGFDYDPYIALPIGEAFYNSTYRTIVQVVLGTYLKTSQYFGINGELGINLKDTDTYLSFGVTYRN
jgi:hypothetical protein